MPPGLRRKDATWISIAERAVDILDPVEVARAVAPAQADEPSRGDVGTVEVRVGDVGPPKIGAGELAAVEPGALEVRVPQRRELEDGTRQVGIREARAIELCRSQDTPHEPHRLIAHVGGQVGAIEACSCHAYA